MRSWIVPSLCAVTLFVLTGMLIGQQQGPIGSPGSTVARPRKSGDPEKKDDPAELPKIPSQYKRDKQEPTPSASFTLDVDIVTLDVAVMDNKGHFIPGIPSGTFRVLEANVPQQVKSVSVGEAPLTTAMVIEFSTPFQRLYARPWYQTLELAWGFASTLKPQDYVAV